MLFSTTHGGTSMLAAWGATRPGAGRRTVILGDSFSRNSFLPLALELGPEVVWIQHRRCNFDPGMVEDENAGLVVYEVVERNVGCDPRSANPIVAAYSGGIVPHLPEPPPEIEAPLACPRDPEAEAPAPATPAT